MAECTGKAYYATRDEARSALLRIQQNLQLTLRNLKRTGYVPKRAYKCPRCHGWHLTSQGIYKKV